MQKSVNTRKAGPQPGSKSRCRPHRRGIAVVPVQGGVLDLREVGVLEGVPGDQLGGGRGFDDVGGDVGEDVGGDVGDGDGDGDVNVNGIRRLDRIQEVEEDVHVHVNVNGIRRSGCIDGIREIGVRVEAWRPLRQI